MQSFTLIGEGLPSEMTGNRTISRQLKVLAVASVLGGVLFLAHETILSAVGDFLVTGDNLAPADVIHVIAGPDERTDYAIQLYQRGYAKKIFFTGGWCRFHNYFHGQRGKERALDRGIPLKAIATDESSVTSTYAEVVHLKEFINRSEEPIRSVIAISDPFHMRRARWTYRRVLGDKVRALVAHIPFESSQYKRDWWMDRGSRRMVGDEYIKLVYYYARYQLSRGSLKEWLASFDRD